MPQQHCAIASQHESNRDLKERLKKFEAALRGHNPDEGYEWPEPRAAETDERG
jgi:hypothetical protein